MKYRSEIDGLRALAVVPVILFHAGFELFSGGFVGVDVFFVISGYLITTILIEDIENKRFSIVNFYERRARRILPALFFVMFVCIPFAWMWMIPSQMKDFSQSLIAVSLFASNILFWRENGYFDGDAGENPLLHTWSLAVEEQYYVLFPIFLILAWRFGKNRVFWMIVVMAAISLLLSEWGWRNHATANFCLAPTRAWELFSGSIAAFVVQKQGVQKNNPLALAGLAAILFSILFYDKATPFPSVYALVPVLGAVLLVLYADKDTLAAKLLSTRGFVGIGLISYSTYLWHQPLFAFERIRSPEHTSLFHMSLLSLISLLLGYFSWRYIEKPFRKKQFLTRAFVFKSAAFSLSLFMFFGALGIIDKGYKSRLSAGDQDLYQRLFNGQTQFEIDVTNKKNFTNDGRKKILIIGDSYAKDFLEGLVVVFGEEINKFDIVKREISRRCKNVLADTKDLNDYINPLDTFCFGSIERVDVFKLSQLAKEADLVVVRSYWDVLPTLQMPRTYDYLDTLNSGKIVFIGSTFFGINNPFKSLLSLKSITPNMMISGYKEVIPYSYKNDGYTSFDLITMANELMKDRNYFDVMGVFCANEVCRITDENNYPLTPDLAHLTTDGERLMIKALFSNSRFRKIWGDSVGYFPGR